MENKFHAHRHCGVIAMAGLIPVPSVVSIAYAQRMQGCRHNILSCSSMYKSFDV